MPLSVFEYTHYIRYLNDWIKSSGHGSKSKLAQAAKVQTAYLSLVLKEKAHLSLEQAARLKSLFEFNQEELDFYLLLIQKNHSGSPLLESIFERQMKETLNKRNLLKTRIKSSIQFSMEDQAKYFSSWHYSAIHTALLIPQLRTKKQLEETLKLPIATVDETIDFLTQLDLIQKNDNEFVVKSFRMHLPSDSALINLHHSNWRLQALAQMQKRSAHNLHYSSVLSISNEDASLLKQKILNLLEEFEKKLKDSPDESLYSLGIDWFSLTT